MPNFSEGIWGKWHVQDDTLYLIPQYEYFLEKDLVVNDITELEKLNMKSVTRKFVFKRKKLIDKTDYSPFLPNWCFEEIPMLKNKEYILQQE